MNRTAPEWAGWRCTKPEGECKDKARSKVGDLASHLADEEVAAAQVDGRVVRQERGHRDTGSICDDLACITRLYYSGGAASRRLYTQAQACG
jgi:hypothetical protein